MTHGTDVRPTVSGRVRRALKPLIDTGNVAFSYQSTAIETWLIDHYVADEDRRRQGHAARCPA